MLISSRLEELSAWGSATKLEELSGSAASVDSEDVGAGSWACSLEDEMSPSVGALAGAAGELLLSSQPA